MSETKKIDLNLLYSTLVREIENDAVQEIDSQFYLTLSDYLGKLNHNSFEQRTDLVID